MSKSRKAEKPVSQALVLNMVPSTAALPLHNPLFRSPGRQGKTNLLSLLWFDDHGRIEPFFPAFRIGLDDIK